MCILMYFGPGAMPIREHLTNGCENNPDGFGWAIVTATEGILVGHSMVAKTAIEEFITTREAYPSETAIFHARIATDGTTSLDNCHPFYINERRDMVLAHNGMLPSRPMGDDKRSDTRILAEDLFMGRFADLDNRHGKDLNGKNNRARFEEWMGASKVIVLTTAWDTYEYQSYLFNESLGWWLDEKDGCPEGQDIWYSNTSNCKRRYTYTYANGYGAGLYSYGLTKSTDSGWPKVIGGKSSGYVESWDSEKDTATSQYNGYTLACVECGFEVDDCLCGERMVRRYIPSWQVKSPPEDEIDWTSSAGWKCRGCNIVGNILFAEMRCEVCDTMFCCDEPSDVCQCAHRIDAFLTGLPFPSMENTPALTAGESKTAVDFIDGVVTDVS